MRNKDLLGAIIIVLMITSIVSLYPPVIDAKNESASIEAANSSINQAFTNVLAAEKAGANVTELLFRLNSAGEYLAEAENAYKSGDLANINSTAENAILIANQVNSDALALREASLVESQNSFWWTLTFSVVGTVALGVALLLARRRFKCSFNNKVLGMKPEAVENTP